MKGPTMPRHPHGIRGKVIAVTGGARGIGAATARAFEAAGARVAIGDLDLRPGRPSDQRAPRKPLGLRLDVTDPACFTAFLDQVENALGPIDVLGSPAWPPTG